MVAVELTSVWSRKAFFLKEFCLFAMLYAGVLANSLQSLDVAKDSKVHNVRMHTYAHSACAYVRVDEGMFKQICS